MPRKTSIATEIASISLASKPSKALTNCAIPRAAKPMPAPINNTATPSCINPPEALPPFSPPCSTASLNESNFSGSGGSMLAMASLALSMEPGTSSGIGGISIASEIVDGSGRFSIVSPRFSTTSVVVSMASFAPPKAPVSLPTLSTKPPTTFTAVMPPIANIVKNGFSIIHDIAGAIILKTSATAFIATAMSAIGPLPSLKSSNISCKPSSKPSSTSVCMICCRAASNFSCNVACSAAAFAMSS